jgi:hypothetical protein
VGKKQITMTLTAQKLIEILQLVRPDSQVFVEEYASNMDDWLEVEIGEIKVIIGENETRVIIEPNKL